MFNKNSKKSQIVHLFAIYDKVSNQYGPLFQAVNVQTALRNYMDFMKNILFHNDYSLYHAGTLSEDLEIIPNKYLVSFNDLDSDTKELLNDWSDVLKINMEVSSEQ